MTDCSTQPDLFPAYKSRKIDFDFEGGDITITTSSDNGFVSVAIADNGCGIPDEIMSKIRDPFFTTKEKDSGSGLGLAIAAELVRGHGGRLDLERTDETGTRFVISLPKFDLILSPLIV